MQLVALYFIRRIYYTTSQLYFRQDYPSVFRSVLLLEVVEVYKLFLSETYRPTVSIQYEKYPTVDTRQGGIRGGMRDASDEMR